MRVLEIISVTFWTVISKINTFIKRTCRRRYQIALTTQKTISSEYAQREIGRPPLTAQQDSVQKKRKGNSVESAEE